ncbi:hypothetical protein DL771_009200 [Monosporascus sp. 5C6A]|nr:hypothetical protein DL771_009200 [Monosporascus sp. 5C6A]
MHRTLVLLQLLLWVNGIHAFYPFVPKFRVADGREGTGRRVDRSDAVLRSRTAQGDRPITSKLSRKAFSSYSDESLMDRVSRIADGLAAKYGSQTRTKEDASFSRRENEHDVMRAEEPTASNSAGIHQDGTDFSYFLEVKLGAEGKPVYMLLDTGAGTSWVMGANCTSEACITHDLFGPDDSSSFVDTGASFTIKYGTGEVSGHIVRDSMSIAELNTTLDFGLATVTSSEFTRFPFEGILGLSTSPDSFLSAIKDAKLLDKNVFGISLSRASDGPNDGEITFGSVNEDRYEGEITYASLVTGDSWAIPLDDVMVDSQPVGIKGKTAYLDTGTTYAFAPKDQVAALFDNVPGASSGDDGTSYTVPCDSKVPIAFTFAGASWNISSADLLSSKENVCTANIFGIEVVKGSWLLGDVFLKNVYSVFDLDESRIGFAAKSAPSGGDTATSTPSPTTAPTGSPASSPTATISGSPSGSSPTSSVDTGSSSDPSAESSSSPVEPSSDVTPTEESRAGQLRTGDKYMAMIVDETAGLFAGRQTYGNSSGKGLVEAKDCTVAMRPRDQVRTDGTTKNGVPDQAPRPWSRREGFRVELAQRHLSQAFTKYPEFAFELLSESDYQRGELIAQNRLDWPSQPCRGDTKCCGNSTMAKAKTYSSSSHGAEAARSASSSSGNNNNREDRHSAAAPGNQEAHGLLSASKLSDEDEDDDGTDDYNAEDGFVVHPGEDDQAPSGHPGRGRITSRVRFDLRPTNIPPPANGIHRDDGPDSPSYSDDEDDASCRRASRDDFEFDMDDSSGASGSDRRPLLTDIEAPSVTVANSPIWGGGGDGDAAWTERPKSGLRPAFMNMANSIIGAGIIGQPYAFKEAGLLAGIALLLALTVVVDWTIRLIVVNSKLSGASSFQGTVQHCFGRPGLVAISVAQWAFAFGGMVAFAVIVGDSIPYVFRAIWPELRDVPVLGLLADRRAVIVIFVVGVSYPLTLYRDIAKLAKASTLALISMVVILVTVMVQSILAPPEARGSFSTPLLTVNSGIFQAVGVISFAFVCHHNSLLIYGSLKTPTLDRFATVTHYSVGVSTLACLAMALAGFLAFGDRTRGNVLNNFPADNTMVTLARLCFGLNMLTTLPLEAFVCREVVLNYFLPPDAPFNLRLHVALSTAHVAAALAVSLLTCDVGAVFDLVGATSACALAYVLPPLCFLRLSSRRDWRTYAAWGVVVFGFVAMIISVAQAVGKMISGDGEGVQCM